VKKAGDNLILLALAALLYLGSYLLMLDPVPRNPFLSGPGPIPMEAHYRVASRELQTLYEPLVRLDRWAFPKRWQRYHSVQFYLPAGTSLDLERIHQGSEAASQP
jgi:hypothetical protein